MRQRLWNAGWLLLLAMAFVPLLPERVSAQDDPPMPAAAGEGEPTEDTSGETQTPATKPAVAGNPARVTKPAGETLPFEIQPKVFYVRDRDGKLQAIPGMTYEQLMEAWKQEHQLPR